MSENTLVKKLSAVSNLCGRKLVDNLPSLVECSLVFRVGPNGMRKSNIHRMR